MEAKDTELDLDAIEARANAATPGPWVYTSWSIESKASKRQKNVVSILLGATYSEYTQDPDELEISKEDAAFIVHARTDIPALIAEVRALRARDQKE